MFGLAKPYLSVRDNERHIENAIEFAFKLLAAHEAERRIVIPAVILHDVGWSRVPQEIIALACRIPPNKDLLRIHEEESVKIAGAILEELGYASPLVTEILEIIGGHDTRDGALSLSDEVVKDADKLTRYASNFSFWAQKLCMTPRHLADALEGTIDEWFFLPTSREMARKELARRRMEDDGREDGGEMGDRHTGA